MARVKCRTEFHSNFWIDYQLMPSSHQMFENYCYPILVFLIILSFSHLKNSTESKVKIKCQNLCGIYLQIDFSVSNSPVIIALLRLPSSVVEHPPCKRKVVSSILTGGSTSNNTRILGRERCLQRRTQIRLWFRKLRVDIASFHCGQRNCLSRWDPR